jgi:hypothetical protein
MLTAERTALNFLQRLSASPRSRGRFVDAAGGTITVLDTRKTTPTLRALEKYAVRAGSGTNHRAGLDDGVLIKDNHIRLAGGVKAAVQLMKDADPEMPIEVEAQSLEQVDEAVAAAPTSSSSTTCRSTRFARREADQRPREDRAVGRRDARSDPRAREDRRQLRVDRRADALGAGRGSEFELEPEP